MRKWKLIAILIFLASPSCGQGKAAKNADEWAARHFKDEVKYVECVDGMSADSDNDGYISCTIFLKSGESPIAIECATENFGHCNSGCRMATGKARK